MIGVQVVILCGASIMMREQAVGKAIPAFLAFDYLSRLIAGGKVSLLGNFGGLIGPAFFHGNRETEPGAPKQFASLCGLMFSGGATACHLTGATDAGAAVTGALMCAAGLEGFFDYCLGCTFYGIGLQLGLI